MTANLPAPSCSPACEPSGGSEPAPAAFPALRRGRPATLQVNLGYRCNQSCSHCHVNAGPSRTEMMDAATLALVPAVLRARGMGTLDVTGGAPELHPGFRELVVAARQLGVTVIDRCNLTILSEPGQEDLADFLADQGVTVVASLPCYSAANVDQQRGDGVFARSIAGLRRLNALGYGAEGSGLELDLVYNPQGPSLPPPQAALEADYRRELAAHFGIRFNRLYTITNMPIQRFAAVLRQQGRLESYMELLRASHNPANLDQVMCRSTISVDWRGLLYDCDFNQMLALPMPGPWRHLRELLEHDPTEEPIAVAEHCFGCTAGAGSSCGGALSGSGG
ncbi:arsenosugar biosynthesis radical SAM (seleno)protein ArsS [Cyanobium sp. CH-040]|uniref:arsenosugar biosynthesis radical SAM (seleno)protein ArsS n=1 Tax=Cyanobium sp. CH-040 TaxID=2823708 RepID=UPI0020CBEE4B|nr:arsenosugar biosynthesis radical SAM (seleno)protein ArsS [Cyanobium sp. CH-040]MCP9927733.1 arsenosugar biosynthesis radical SAM protein ArsS [Cyanobium sp. CH-040]